jgi:hypothetical protein
MSPSGSPGSEWELFFSDNYKSIHWGITAAAAVSIAPSSVYHCCYVLQYTTGAAPLQYSPARSRNQPFGNSSIAAVRNSQ